VTETEALYAYRMMLVAEGRECEHPEQWRRAVPLGGPNYPFPQNWECGVCEVWYVYDPWLNRARPVNH
jgi:hypothetical protein